MKYKIIFLVFGIMVFVNSVYTEYTDKKFNENMFEYVEGNLDRTHNRPGYNMKIVVDYQTPD
ncbi:hypothetical protein [Aeromonas phage AS-zj]|uniref:Uncharacterized protein n=4 Tax=Ceceduovirus TaxID=2842588 RepID=A0A291LDX7_9CAUD|nr:hypothetical protein HWB28_gp095 [Aeromonas phage AS-zj]YP_009835030.1 hypothetical protein HWB29_gp328 [Aeromonas phage AS-sw]ATI17540.1 hypothetical protein [Aeromonas phage AS-szw]QAX97981.1 hypothetical protein ASswx1_340 [Aeromonas phage Asswx_1]QAX98975.1 hypothetical protein assk_184 [Aeromonas phage Assk]QMV29076.1 hypothetical protein AP1_0369 [Aeromonas phage AP1]ASU00457.1 hypothetical protein [Aeromonas phage AS-zj]